MGGTLAGDLEGTTSPISAVRWSWMAEIDGARIPDHGDSRNERDSEPQRSLIGPRRGGDTLRGFTPLHLLHHLP